MPNQIQSGTIMIQPSAIPQSLGVVREFYCQDWRSLGALESSNWSKLTDDDLQKISGKREQLAGKIQEIYGITRREAEKQVRDWGKSVERVSKKIA